MNRTYDYILAGGGLAGLSLAWHMYNSSLRDKRILIVDSEQKTKNDRTWCFWSKEAHLYEEVVYRTWNSLRFCSDGVDKRYELHPYRYQLIRGIDFYAYIRNKLQASPNVTFLNAQVDQVLDTEDGARVIADGQNYQADWVFDSLFRVGDFRPNPGKYHFLRQHFKGWVIETENRVFDPDTPVMFDFRTPQDGAMRFMYTLPFSAQQALVEYTLFSPTLLKDEEYLSALRVYLSDVIGAGNYRILEEESGIIPMTDQPFPRRGGRHILNTGTRGGRVKPSTGYAFLRIQKDSAAIIHSLQTSGDPFHIPADSARYQLLDSTMLQVMYRHGGDMKNIFTRLFTRNPIQRIFRFLDETGPIYENPALMLTLPVIPFARALLKTRIFGRI